MEGCIAAACDLSALECADHVGAGLTPSYRGDDLFHQQLSEACGIISVVPNAGHIAPYVHQKWLQFHVFQGASHAFGGRGHQRAPDDIERPLVQARSRLVDRCRALALARDPPGIGGTARAEQSCADQRGGDRADGLANHVQVPPGATGAAGPIAQECVNYCVGRAVLGDPSAAAAGSASLCDWMREDSRGRHVWLPLDPSELSERLASRGVG